MLQIEDIFAPFPKSFCSIPIKTSMNTLTAAELGRRKVIVSHINQAVTDITVLCAISHCGLINLVFLCSFYHNIHNCSMMTNSAVLVIQNIAGRIILPLQEWK